MDPRVQEVISDLENSVSYSQYIFNDGKDTVNGLTLKELMAPQGAENAFSNTVTSILSAFIQV